jgi:hypothetical protein
MVDEWMGATPSTTLGSSGSTVLHIFATLMNLLCMYTEREQFKRGVKEKRHKHQFNLNRFTLCLSCVDICSHQKTLLLLMLFLGKLLDLRCFGIFFIQIR